MKKKKKRMMKMFKSSKEDEKLRLEFMALEGDEVRGDEILSVLVKNESYKTIRELANFSGACFDDILPDCEKDKDAFR